MRQHARSSQLALYYSRPDRFCDRSTLLAMVVLVCGDKRVAGFNHPIAQPRPYSYSNAITPLPSMERGLMWLPLLAIFIWLARAGANEYQKLEAYKRWAAGFDRCKYDIYAVMGLKDREITWGKPTKTEPQDLQTFSLDLVRQIQLVVDNQPIDLTNLPSRGQKIVIQFQLADDRSIEIPFTEISMAAEWAKFLNSLA